MGRVVCRVALFVGAICLGCSGLFADDAVAKPLEVEAVLKNWHEKVSQYQGLKGTFVRTTYDNVFQMQKLSKGTFNVNRSGEAAYCWNGYQPGNPRLKTGKDGKPYIFQADQDEAWYWVNNTIIQVDKSNRTYDRIKIPKDAPDNPSPWTFFGWTFYPPSLKQFWVSEPYLLGMPPEELKKRFQIEIVNQTEEKVQLNFRPKERRDLANFSEASLILNIKTYLPYALKTIDPPRTKETVHLFSDVEGIKELERISEPDLTRYESFDNSWTTKSRKRKKKNTLVAVESEINLLGTLYIAPLSMGETNESEW